MVESADLLIPAVSAVIGAIVGGGATIISQILTQRGTYKREREARRDAFQTRRFEIERDTLLALQDAVTKHSLTLSSYINGDLPADIRATDTDLLDDWREVVKLAHRVLDRDAAQAATEYCDVAHRAAQDPHGERQNLISAFGKAQQALGAAIRHDPFQPDSGVG
ncbi:hypothetical protein ABGB17_03645 [Sphaerisporangium sp. B11E5]|uniref:hypothetical protein n=1 Tax=Sphaerisporangium sp. B11E5 TaxID=3153563 RepID=UPI00325F8FF6